MYTYAEGERGGEWDGRDFRICLLEHCPLPLGPNCPFSSSLAAAAHCFQQSRFCLLFLLPHLRCLPRPEKEEGEKGRGVGMDAKTSKPRGSDRPSTLAAPLWCSKRRRRRGCVVGFCKVVSSMLRLASSLSCCCFHSLSLFLLCPLVSLSMHQKEEEAATKRKTLHLCCSLPQSGRKTHFLFHFCFSWTPYQGHNFLFLLLFVLAASPVLVGNCQIQPSTLFFSRGFEWKRGKKGRELHIFLSRLLEFPSATTTTPARGGRTRKGLKEEEEGKKGKHTHSASVLPLRARTRKGALNSTEPQQRRRRRRSSSLPPSLLLASEMPLPPPPFGSVPRESRPGRERERERENGRGGKWGPSFLQYWRLPSLPISSP